MNTSSFDCADTIPAEDILTELSDGVFNRPLVLWSQTGKVYILNIKHGI